VKGWSRNREAERNKRNVYVVAELDLMDREVELNKLTDHQNIVRQELRRELEHIWHIEEISARQRARDREIKDEAKNTSYFFALANHRKRKKCIPCLEVNGVMLNDNKDMVNHAMNYYKQLFGKEPRSNIRFRSDFWEENEKVSSEENWLLKADFTEEEIHATIKGSHAKGATGPDGFSFLFYQKFWPIIKRNLMAMVKSFEKAEVNLARLSYARIILVPKEEGTTTLKKFRPINLINYSFKIFAKASNNRLIGCWPPTEQIL
jgi:hypothetical protein